MTKKELKQKIEKLEKKLEEKREEFTDLELYIKDLISFTPIGICLLSGVGKIVNSNKTVREVTQYGSVELSGKALKDFFKEKDKIEDFLKKASKEEKVKNKEVTIITKEDEEVPVSLSVAARADSEGNILGYFVGFSDISELSELKDKLEQKVEERTRELKDRVRKLEKFRKLTEGRELRMAELKEKNEKLEGKIKKIKEKNNE